ncbi:DnaJ sub C member 12 [Dispira simplex]|nr:DnaJ sub C member 12 [Dispira simplex]
MDYSKVLEDLADQDSFWNDLYRVLGCAPSNTREQITAEYKRRALLHHPDKRINGQTSDEEFVRLTEAYKILSDNDQRKQYDRWRTSGLKLSYTKWCQLGEQAQKSMDFNG